MYTYYSAMRPCNCFNILRFLVGADRNQCKSPTNFFVGRIQVGFFSHLFFSSFTLHSPIKTSAGSCKKNKKPIFLEQKADFGRLAPLDRKRRDDRHTPCDPSRAILLKMKTFYVQCENFSPRGTPLLFFCTFYIFYIRSIRENILYIFYIKLFRFSPFNPTPSPYEF